MEERSEKEKEIAEEPQLEKRDEEDGVTGIQDEEDQVDDEQVVEESSTLVPLVSRLGPLNSSTLCSTCLSIDFTALYSASQRYLPDAAGYECPPRTVNYISQHETQCAFCALTSFCLMHLHLERVPEAGAFTVTSLGVTAGFSVKDLGEGVLEEAQNTTALDGAHNNGYVRTLFTVCELADKNDLYYFVHRDVGGGRTLIELRERPCYKKNTVLSIQPFFDEIDDLPKETLLSLSGRAFGTQIRFDLVRYWVSHLDSSQSSDAQPSPIKLIDTVDGRLIDADTNFRYSALSYVWGRYKQVTLTSDSYVMLHSIGSITDGSQTISWTIKDAITVCRNVGQRYLWVDCLCIQQDDVLKKMSQIERMDKVYGHAEFTIVNAGHQSQLSADSPIPGVRPDSRKLFQACAHAESFSILANSCPPLQEDLGLSKWRTRAWTFQEELLSPALLIFTSSQCFFQRGKRLFCEDMIFESGEDHTALIPLTYNTTQSYHHRADADATGEFDIEDYCFLIESYVKRDLTFEDDAIKAISGLLARFSESLDGRKSRFIFGHPSAAFDYSLCWIPTCYYPNLPRRTAFPSWSWASRKQHVDFELGHRHNKRYHLTSRGPPATSIYTDALSDGRFTLNKLLQDQIGVDVLPVKVKADDAHLYYLSHGLDPALLTERELQFSTTCAKLRISRYSGIEGEKLEAGRSSHNSPWGCFVVYSDHPGASGGTIELGEIRLEAAWRDAQPEVLSLDFIVVRAVPGPEPFSNVRAGEKDKQTGTPPASKTHHQTDDSQLAEIDQDTVTNSGHEVSAPTNISPKRFPALEDSRLNESARDRKFDEDSYADGTIMAAEDWRLSLMCIEWLDLPSGPGGTGEGKKKETMRRVARRLDVVRYGPSVRTWLDLGPERVNVVLV